MIIIWLFALALSTIWIWLPILIIVPVRKSNKKNALREQQMQAAQQQSRPPVQKFSSLNDAKKEELNQKIYAELKEPNPNMDMVKLYMKEIEDLSAEPQPQPQQPGMADYSYNGMPPSAGQNVVRRANVASTTPALKTENHAGLNAILYIGSLLVVAGVGALVASIMDDSIKMMIMILIIAIFYLGGMFMRRDKRLVGASKALIGTALATIPFLGFGFAEFLSVPGEIAWLITSVIGLIAYVATTIVLKSKVIAYLSMAFLISLCLSMTATLALPMMYYFMFVMLIGVVAGVVRMAAGKKVPELFSSVVEVTGKWLTILTLVVSLLFVGMADGQMYTWLFWLATAQSALMWADTKKLPEELLFRLLAHISILVTCAQIFSDDVVTFGVIFLALAVVHTLISFALSVFVKKDGRMASESSVIGVMLVAVLFSFVFILFGGDERAAAVVCMLSMIFVGAMSGVMTAVHKKIGWLYGVMGIMVALPLVIGSWVMPIGSRWSASVYFVIYLFEMLAAVLLRFMASKKRVGCDALGLCALMVYGFMALMFSVTLESGYQIIGMVLWTLAVGAYGWTIKRISLYEMAVYFGTGTLCRIAIEILSGIGADVWTYTMILTYIIAAALIGTSIWREKADTGKIRLGFAMGLLTMMVGTRALSATGIGDTILYPVWFLVLHVIYVVVGGLWKKKWMWVWGACGVALAIMWFVRDMAFIWLIMLGFGLIALVVWSLLRPKK
ncbi:MAG: hypothetical protein ACK5MU_01715 [Candidatus Saccharimonadales bacterium]